MLCDAEDSTPCDEVYSESKKAQTCTESGTITYICYCGESYQEEIPTTGHNNVGGKCSNCGYDFTKECSCKCHKSGFTLFIWKIGNFTRKIFGKDKVCACGVKH